MKTFAVIGGLAACMPSAPDAPSFQQDVMPIFAANCVRCHGYPALGGAPGEPPDGFRLDSFDDVVVDDSDPANPIVIRGAASIALAIPGRVQSSDRPMPPRFPIEDHQIETLVTWASADPPTRGEPRPDNRSPAFTVTEIGRDAAIIHLAYELDDPDGDLVVGQLRAVGVVDRLVAPVQSGRLAVAWDTTGLATGEYDLVVRIDDGSGSIDAGVGTITIGGP